MSEQTPEINPKDAADLAEFRLSGLPVINASGVDAGMLQADKGLNEIAMRWGTMIESARSAPNTAGGIFNRRAYTPPENVYDIRAAIRHAYENDDVVRACVDLCVNIMFENVEAEASDPLAADLMNQIFAEIDMDNYLRQLAREVLLQNEAVTAKRYGFLDLKARGKTENGNKKKTRKTVYGLVGIGLVEQQHVVPINPTPVGEDTLAWQAHDDLVERYRLMRSGIIDDPAMREFYTSLVNPDTLPIYEMERLGSLGVNYTNLIELNPELVFRHTDKQGYQRHAMPRLKTLLPLLDLKRNKILADRANLIGSAQYFVLITKGSEKQPATQAELENLNQNMKVLAKLPVMVADHRLDIKIVAPPQDFVLDPAVYESLDTQIAAATLSLLGVPIPGATEINPGLLARNLESVRHMLKRTIERQVIRQIVNHPLNAGIFDAEPNITFSPNRIRLTSDVSIQQMLLNLRQNREISRETILGYLGIDEEAESLRVLEEKERYDHIFESIVAYSGAQPDGVNPDTAPTKSGETPSQSGARGGRPAGRGAGVRAGKVSENTKNGNPSTTKAD